MALIDDKGRLFGLINIFDLFVIGIIALVAAFSFQWAKLAEDPSWVKVETMRVKCEGVAVVPSYVFDLMKDGDSMVNEEGINIAEIKKVVKAEPMQVKLVTYSNSDEGELLVDKDNKKVTLILEMAAFKKNTIPYLYASNGPFNVGYGFLMNTRDYVARVNIVKILH